jgi:hypothetical protein
MIPVSAAQATVHDAVSGAIDDAVQQYMSPFLEGAADALQTATDLLERVPSAALEKAFSKSLDVVTPLERMTRSPSELLEAGALGAGITRAASHVLGEHGPAMRQQASRMMEASSRNMQQRVQGMNRAASVMLERAASRVHEASISFERAASRHLDDLGSGHVGSLDAAIEEALKTIKQEQWQQQPSSPRKSYHAQQQAERHSRFKMGVLAEGTAF